MTSIFRIGVCKLSCGGISPRLCKVSSTHNVVPAASMMRDAYLDKKLRPKPYPYWNKDFNVFNEMIDPMLKRLYENSKLVVVEGPIAAGKSRFAEKLADQFKMLYMPAPTHDQIYINKYGFDLRTLDAQLPPTARSADLPKFLANPKEIGAHFQYHFLQMRFEQYMNALLHILSTGQGVVLNRCFYSDSVFEQSMCSMGYMRKEVLDYFTIGREAVAEELMRPHLVIYLDAPVETVKENIRKRGIPEEVNSETFNTQYFSEIEKNYKESYLSKIVEHSHLLMYDWTKERDIVEVIEDIEDLDFDSQIDSDGKLGDWIFMCTDQVCGKRRQYAEREPLVEQFLSAGHPNVPLELLTTPEDCIAYDELMEEIDSERYEAGYNVAMGDKILWKRKEKGLEKVYSFRKTIGDFVNRDKYMT